MPKNTTSAEPAQDARAAVALPAVPVTRDAREAYASAVRAEQDAAAALDRVHADADAGRDLAPLAIATATEELAKASRRLPALKAAAEREGHDEAHAQWRTEIAAAQQVHDAAIEDLDRGVEQLRDVLGTVVGAHAAQGNAAVLVHNLRAAEPRTAEHLAEHGHTRQPTFTAPPLDGLLAGTFSDVLRANGMADRAIELQMRQTGDAWPEVRD